MAQTATVGQELQNLALSAVVATLLTDRYDISWQLKSFEGQRVLLRADLNVPISVDGTVADDTRIRAVLPTISMLLGAGAKVIIISHLGRPEPRKQTWDEMCMAYSLAPVARVLTAVLGDTQFVGMAANCVGDQAQAAAAALHCGQAVLLENTRFHLGDTENSNEFAQQLASLADIFVCDAFGVLHRNNASVTGVAAHIPRSYPGPLIRHELTYLMHHMERPARPLCVIMGGAKVGDKIGVLTSLIPKADVVLIGGRMAFTFLAAQGVSVGATQVDEGAIPVAASLIKLAAEKNVKLLLPHDVRVSMSLQEAQDVTVQHLSPNCCTPEMPCLPKGCFGVDIGPASEDLFTSTIAKCKTIFWNGPMGKFEVPEFAQGTAAVAAAMAEAFTHGATTIVGGGDSVAAVNQLNLASKMSHVSTGGGASLELLEGQQMPGLRALLH